jgi:nucleoside-diphosphate-sugar epimerase
MKKIIITGYKGKIGSVVSNGLCNEFDLVLLDLPEFNILDKEKLIEKTKDVDCIIHLAWNCRGENISNGLKDPNNLIMTQNIYDVAVINKIPRVIVASSVNVHDINQFFEGKMEIDLETTPNPISPYGEDKVILEKEGYKISKKGVEVICVRYGGVIPKEQIAKNDMSFVGLTHNDLIDLIKTCIQTKKIPKNYCIIYGVSNSENRIHTFENNLNWTPKENITDCYKFDTQ